MDKKLKGNLAMGTSKTFSGLNENALKYLVPNWMSPLSGVAIRLCFGALAFWITGMFTRKEKAKSTLRQRLTLLAIGIVFMFGYMVGLLKGLAYTTPISSSIFISLQPIVVFIISAIFFHEKVTGMKVGGILLGLGGALIIILTQKNSAVASNAMLGNMYCMFSTITYSIYLVLTGMYLKKLDKVTVSKWTFLGGAISAVVTVAIVGFHAPALTHKLISMAWGALAFVLLFPTFVSYFLLDIGLKCLSTTVVALYANVILIVATVVSYIVGQDIFDWWQIVSIVLIIVSVYLVEVAERKSDSSLKSDDKAGAVVDKVDGR